MLRNFSITFAICRKTTIFAIRNCVALTKVSMNRLFIILSTLLALLSSCSGKQQGDAPQAGEGFDITGVWRLVDRVSSKGAHYMYGGNSIGYKMYDVDSICFNFSLAESNGKFYIIPHNVGYYSLDEDTLYMENNREMPLNIINDSTIITVWKNEYTETWRRVKYFPENRKSEFRSICHQAKQNNEKHVPHEFDFSVTEEKLEYNKYYWAAAVLGIIVLFIVIYTIEITRRKQRVEQSLAHTSDAIKQVEDDFFQSDYYTALRIRIAEGSNMTDEDWREMERQVNAMSSGFTRKLRSLYDFSDVEYQVCLLIKLRIPHKDIAAITHRAPDSVSSIRSRLHKKILGPDGGAKEWDYFVLSL